MENVSDVILPISSSPFGSTGFDLILLNTIYHIKPTHPWIYSNYINLFIIEKKKSWLLTTNDGIIDKWQNIFFMKYNILLKENVQKGWNNYSHFAREYIDKDFYILFPSIDHYYLSPSRLYKRKHQLHGLFVYGYNKEKKFIYCGDFFFSRSNKFETSTISFEELNNSVTRSFDLFDSKPMQNPEDLYMMKFADKFTPALEKWDYKTKIKNRLKEYLESSIYESSCRKPEGKILCQGIAVNQYFMKNINYIDKFIYKGIDFYKSHKSCMYHRVLFLKDKNLIDENDPIINEMEKINYHSITLQGLLFKYKMTMKKNILVSMKDILKKIDELEHKTLPKLFDYVC